MRISNFKLGIGVPTNFPMVPSPFFDSFITMEKPDYCYLRALDGKIDDMRNQLAREALLSHCTHLIMMDADQTYHPQTIPRLLAHRLPIVGCLVYRRYPPFDPLMLTGGIGGYTGITTWEPDALVEVDATGTGCLLFDTEVFRGMPYPWFRFRTTGAGDTVGEDFGFCADLRARGYRIYVDTSVPAGHLTSLIVNDGTYRLYGRVKDAEQKAMHSTAHGVRQTTP
jgi:hypothetical protein